MNFDERLKKLMEMGLTEYQARVYLALLKLGKTTAGEIPSESKVPRTRIYSTLKGLHEKGLVEIIPEKPAKYAPVKIENFLQAQVDALHKKADELQNSFDTLSKEFAILEEPKGIPKGKVEALFGRKAVKQKIIEIARNSQEVYLVGSNNLLARLKGMAKVELENKAYIMTHINDEILNEAVRAQDWAKIKHIPTRPQVQLVVSKNEVLISHPVPDDADPNIGEDVAIWTNDAAITGYFLHCVNESWKDALELSGRGSPGKTLISIGMWLNNIGINLPKLFEELGRNTARELIQNISSKNGDEEGLFKELASFWEKHAIGKFSVESKNPLVITFENFVDCRAEKAISESICLFVQAFTEELFEKKLGKKIAVERKCSGFGTKCILAILMKEEKAIAAN
ncbi:MAG: helix-turn-helix domain-containing protein [Thermoplasmata archaeon]